MSCSHYARTFGLNAPFLFDELAAGTVRDTGERWKLGPGEHQVVVAYTAKGLALIAEKCRYCRAEMEAEAAR